MGYWKNKVLPKIKQVFILEKNVKKAAVEATKSFDDSREEINKELEEKKTLLQPKVIEIYEASSLEIKGLVKEPNEDELKKHSAAVTIFLEDLAKIDFPGSKAVSEASSKLGPTYVSGCVFFVFEKVSTFIVEESAPAAEEPAGEETSTAKEVDVIVEEAEETVVVVEEKGGGTVVVEEKKEVETVVVVVEEKGGETVVVEEKKEVETVVVVEEKKKKKAEEEPPKA